MLRPQTRLLEGIPDVHRHNTPKLPIGKIELGNFLYTLALPTSLDGSQTILTSTRAI